MPGSQYLRFKASLTVSSTGKAFKKFGDQSWQAAARTVRSVGERALEFAKENVAEGKGPGPHPHLWPHEDTGDLGRSLGLKFDYSGGSRINATIYCDEEYGVYLEVGWKTPKGNFYRYPWMKPAFRKAGQGFAKVATDNWKRAVSDTSTGQQVMSSGEVDAYGGKVLELLKPLEGWKEPTRSNLPPEFVSILTAAEVQSEPSHARGKRKLVHISQHLHDVLSGKESHTKATNAKTRHNARTDNRNTAHPARQSAQPISRKGKRTGGRSGIRTNIRRLGTHIGEQDRKQAVAQKARSAVNKLRQAGKTRKRKNTP